MSRSKAILSTLLRAKSCFPNPVPPQNPFPSTKFLISLKNFSSAVAQRYDFYDQTHLHSNPSNYQSQPPFHPAPINAISQESQYTNTENNQFGYSNCNSEYPTPSNANFEIAPSTGPIEDLDTFCKQMKVKEAVEMLEVLQNKGIIIDLPRYFTLMQVCGEVGVLQYAKSIHTHLVKSGLHIEIHVYNKILEMYSKCGSMSDAYEVFEKMLERNLTSWDVMIVGCANNGLGEDAIDLFTEFKEAGLRPDGEMFVGVFLACGVMCDVEAGMLHFEEMRKVYGVVPAMEHYVRVVNMLASVGYLDEAKEFVEKMPFEPSVDVWECLMNNCRVHGNVELGDHCAEIVSVLDPTRLTHQTKGGLLPVKASDQVIEVEKKKLLNLLDVKSRQMQYRAGDRSQPDSDKLYDLLRRMSTHMKEAGYVPFLKGALHDVDDESKEEALLSHSERLAVAQALITTPPRSTIRIIKNLRVCVDCHNVMMMISKIVGRELISRDTKRFHHCKDGRCSCNNFW